MTEIALYFGYVQSKYKTLWKYSTKSRYIQSACVGRNRIDTADTVFDNEIFQPSNHVVMIHRYVWDILSTERKERYKNFLISRGISSAEILI
jgi:hypothetical protein